MRENKAGEERREERRRRWRWKREEMEVVRVDSWGGVKVDSAAIITVSVEYWFSIIIDKDHVQGGLSFTSLDCGEEFWENVGFLIRVFVDQVLCVYMYRSFYFDDLRIYAYTKII